MNKIKLFAKILICSVTALPVLCFVGCKGGYETKECIINEDFDNITLLLDTSNVQILPSDSENTRVVYQQKKNLTHRATVNDGTLNIEVSDTRKWFQKLFNVGGPSVTVYLPKSEYSALYFRSDTGDLSVSSSFKLAVADIAADTGDVDFGASVSGGLKIEVSTGDVSVTSSETGSLTLSATTGDVSVGGVNAGGAVSVVTSTGDISLKNINCASLYTEVTTGKTDISAVNCESFASRGSTGDLNMSSLVANGKIDIARSTGDVKFSGCDGAEVYIKVDTGDVRGSFLTDKVIFASTSTGKISVPKLTSGGRCEIETDTGNIDISIN